MTNLRKKLTHAEFVEQSQQIHGTWYDYSTVVYQHSLKPVTITCPLHGGWATTPNNHVHRKSGCPTCAGHIRNKHIFIKRAEAVHGSRYEYNQFNVVPRGDDILPIVCAEHGVFHQRAIHHVNGRGCPRCGAVAAGLKQRNKKRRKMLVVTI